MFVTDINRRRDACPHAKGDSLLTVIGHVNNAVINTVLAEGTMFRSHNNYAENSMFRPLESIQDLMKSFLAHVERWAFRVKLLDHLDPEITRIHRSRYLSDTLKFSKIQRRLEKVGPIDDHYCSTFTVLSDELGPVVETLDSLAKFLNAICSEGDSLSPDRLQPYRIRAPSSVTIIQDTEACNSPALPSGDVVAPASPITPSPSLPTLIVSFPSTTRARPITATTPSWKIALSERYPVNALFVSPTELQVLSRVLAATREAKDAVEDAQRLCQERGELANDMQQVFEAWSQKSDDFRESSNRPQEEMRREWVNRNMKLRKSGRRSLRTFPN